MDQINIPLLGAAALANGLNPCGIGLAVLFLGYLLVFGQGGEGEKNRRLLLMGAVYILSVFAAYLLLGMLFYNLAYYLQRTVIAKYLYQVMGFGLVLAGAIQLKDAIWPESPVHLRAPVWAGAKMTSIMEKASLPAAAVMGWVTTAVGTPCMMPLYVGTAVVLANSNLSAISAAGYFIYYNLIFISPLILVLLFVYKTKQIVNLKEMEHRWQKWMRLALGGAMIVLGFWLTGQ